MYKQKCECGQENEYINVHENTYCKRCLERITPQDERQDILYLLGNREYPTREEAARALRDLAKIADVSGLAIIEAYQHHPKAI